MQCIQQQFVVNLRPIGLLGSYLDLMRRSIEHSGDCLLERFLLLLAETLGVHVDRHSDHVRKLTSPISQGRG